MMNQDGKEIIEVEPKKLLIANSILLIATSLFLTYFISMTIFLGHSPSGIMGGLFLLPGVVTVGLLQYKATFKKNINSAHAISIWLIIIGLFVLFALIATLIEELQGETDDPHFIVFFSLICAAIVVYIAFCIFLNLRWAKALKQSQIIQKKCPKTIVFVFILIFFIGGVHGYLTGDAYQYAENVESVNWLPKTASNISYYKSYYFTAYEFTISEGDFLDLAKKEEWGIEKIKEPFEISRYTHGKNSKGDKTSIIINSGYFYKWRQGNGGGISVAFDTEKQRAYFQSNPR